MLLAEFEVRHSRPFAPTRRVALGSLFLPTDPAPGFGGLLLAGLVATCSPKVDDEFRDGLDGLLDDVERSRKILQPRLRYRFQHDTHGLDRSRHKLTGDGEQLRLELDEHGAAMPQILAAVYAAGMLERAARASVFRLLRRASRWHGESDDEVIGFLTGDRPNAIGAGDEGWALSILGFEHGIEPTRSEINRRFRRLIRDAHPDHGGSTVDAGKRILDLTEAKRILLAVG